MMFSSKIFLLFSSLVSASGSAVGGYYLHKYLTEKPKSYELSEEEGEEEEEEN